MVKGRKIKQLNNLTIRHTDAHQYSVWTPDGVCWEDRLTLAQAEEFCRNTKDFVKRPVQTNPGKTVKKVIAGIQQKYAIEDITIIDGYHIIFSGAFDDFLANCDPNMILYRNKMLKRTVIAKYVFNHRKLFLFLEHEDSKENENAESNFPR